MTTISNNAMSSASVMTQSQKNDLEEFKRLERKISQTRVLPLTAFAQSTPLSVRRTQSGRQKGKERIAQKKGKKKGGRKGRSDRGGGGFTAGRPKVVVTLREIVPDEVDVRLVWSGQYTLTNVGLAYASVRFQTNGLYDPDPIIGGVSFTGLVQWGAMYSYYRGIRVQYELEIANREAFPMMVYLYHSNSDPGATVGVVGQTYAQQQWGKRRMLGAADSGKSVITIRGSVPFASLLGSDRSLMDEDNYRGVTTGSNPVDLFYMGFNTDSNVVQTALGCLYTLKLTVDTKIYDRRLL